MPDLVKSETYRFIPAQAGRQTRELNENGELEVKYTPAEPAKIVYTGCEFDPDFLAKLWHEYRQYSSFDFFAWFDCHGNQTTIYLACNMAICENREVDPAEYMAQSDEYLRKHIVNDTLIMLSRARDFFLEGHTPDEVINLVFPDRRIRKKREAKDKADREEKQRLRQERREQRRARKAEAKAAKADKNTEAGKTAKSAQSNDAVA